MQRSIQKPAGDFVEVLRMLTHSLSQPLTSLHGSVEVALMGELNESECRQTLELSLQESHRMAEILEVLRDVVEMEGSSEGPASVSWTQSVKNLLQKAALVGEGKCLSLVSGLQSEVRVKARPQQLEKATARLIGRAVKAVGEERWAQIRLSLRAKTACLSVCEEGGSLESCAGGCQMHSTTGSMETAGLEEWIIRRAIEHQGGWYEVIQVSGTRRCYQLNLPVAPSKVERQG